MCWDLQEKEKCGVIEKHLGWHRPWALVCGFSPALLYVALAFKGGSAGPTQRGVFQLGGLLTSTPMCSP